MSEADRIAAALAYQEQMPAMLNPNLARQGARGRANMMPPTSIMDERYPAFKRNQEDVEKLMLGVDLVGSAIPLAGPAMKGAKVLGQHAAPQLAQALENYAFKTGMALPMVERQAGRTFAAPQDEALRLAQQRAALPVSQGGLGLPKNNTAEQRATALGFLDDSYHGSTYDVRRFDPRKASTESYAGQGFYSTLSPEDASINYASVFGPDVKAKINRMMDMGEKDWRRIYRKLEDETLSPEQQRVLLGHSINADNLGVVYPVKTRSSKSIHIDEPEVNPPTVGPFERYDEALDQYFDTPHTKKFDEALNEFGDLGGDTNAIREAVVELGGDSPINASELYLIIEKVASKSGGLMDDSGELVSSGVAAGNFMKHFGVDEIRHTPKFKNQQLNIGGEHIISFDPDNVRSRFAAFDPWRINAATAAAMGVAAPDLLAKEKNK